MQYNIHIYISISIDFILRNNRYINLIVSSMSTYFGMRDAAPPENTHAVSRSPSSPASASGLCGPPMLPGAPVAFVARRLAGRLFSHPDYGPVDVSEVSVEEGGVGSFDFRHAVPVVTLSATTTRPPQVLYCPTPALTSVSEARLAAAVETALKYAERSVEERR